MLSDSFPEQTSPINPTMPDLTLQDFVVQGDNSDAFKYPFRYTEPTLWMRDPENQTPLGPHIEEQNWGETGTYFFDTSIDPQKLVNSLRGPAIEIGGPTATGFKFLDGVSLPNRPLITNIAGTHNEEAGAHSVTSLDKLVLDTLADGRMLPFKDQSVGILFASALPVLLGCGDYPENATTEQIVEVNATRQTIIDTIMPRFAEIWKSAHGTESDPLKIRDAQEKITEIADSSVRIGFLMEAQRTLEPNGLLILASMQPDEIEVASLLGFQVVGHLQREVFPPEDTRDSSTFEDVPFEIVFQKKT